MFDDIKIMADRFASDPKNGTQGLWRVSGVRHNAIIRASSAPEAVEKALKAKVVGDWELLDAEFIGVEMPNIYEY